MPEKAEQTLPKFRQNKYFAHKLSNGRNLLITELGRFTDLSEKELQNFKKGQLSKELFQKLEQAHIIATEKNKPQMVEDYRLKYCHTTEGVSLHIVNPTMRCNQKCLYCYANSLPLEAKGADMDEKTAKKVVDFIWQTPLKDFVIEFQGAEPLANFPMIEFIINYASKKKGKKVHWRIVSNLSLMDNDIAKFFKKKGLVDICTSLDGPKKVHDKNRILSGASAFDKTVYWINSLRQDHGIEYIGALCTVTKYSLPYAKEIVDTYLGLGLPDITPVPLRRIGLAAKNWDKIGYKSQDYFDFWKQTLEYCIQKTRQGKPISEQFSAMMLQKMNKIEPCSHTCFSKPCGAALMQCSYQPNGDIYTCDEGKAEPMFKIGTVNQSYKEVFTSPEALNMVSISSALGFACNECPFTGFCRICPVMLYATQKNFIPKLALDQDCQTKKKQFKYLLDKLFGKDKDILEKWQGK
jgi:His-Xaa-Ser system radical SAM maturase HxsB